MQCPNCRSAEDDAAAECSQCGLVFAKWRAATQQTRTGEAPAALSLSLGVKESGWGLWIWAAVLLSTVGVWFLNRSGEETAAANALFAEKAKTAAATPAPNDAWRFAGHVYDLLRGGPIKGAKVSFLDFETGQYYQDVTDDEGHYSVDVAIRWKQGYALDISHPLYQQRYWTAPALSASRSDRLRMGLEPPSGEPDSRAYRATRKSSEMTLDFALFPQDLTDTERDEAGL